MTGIRNALLMLLGAGVILWFATCVLPVMIGGDTESEPTPGEYDGTGPLPPYQSMTQYIAGVNEGLAFKDRELLQEGPEAIAVWKAGPGVEIVNYQAVTNMPIPEGWVESVIDAFGEYNVLYLSDGTTVRFRERED
jgi:hypothetical protein